jgi:hypothetical protein
MRKRAATQLTRLFMPVIAKCKHVVRDYDPMEDLVTIRISTLQFDLLMIPGSI